MCVVVTWTYSSIFVASAISYDWIHRKAKDGDDALALATGEKKTKQKVAVTA